MARRPAQRISAGARHLRILLSNPLIGRRQDAWFETVLQVKILKILCTSSP
jgi:hypothetical protein